MYGGGTVKHRAAFLFGLILLLLLPQPGSPQWARKAKSLWSGWVNLAGYWPLDEESGTRYDLIGTNHLTDYNTVGYAAGKHNNAASFVAANSEALYRTNHSGLPAAPGDWTLAAWVKPTTVVGAGIVGTQDLAHDPVQGGWYLMQMADTGLIRCGLYSVAHAAQYVLSTTGVVAGEWSLVMGWHDSVAKKLYVSINNGTPDELDVSTVTILDDPGPLAVGVIPWNGSYVLFFYDGLIDEPAVWDVVLTADQRTAFYAAGAGKFYPN